MRQHVATHGLRNNIQGNNILRIIFRLADPGRSASLYGASTPFNNYFSEFNLANAKLATDTTITFTV